MGWDISGVQRICREMRKAAQILIKGSLEIHMTRRVRPYLVLRPLHVRARAISNILDDLYCDLIALITAVNISNASIEAPTSTIH